jgi:polyhydroxybutyrate depolymerase
MGKGRRAGHHGPMRGLRAAFRPARGAEPQQRHRRRATWPLSIALLLCVAGCAAAVVAPPAPPGTRTVTLRTGDGDRSAIVHRAASAAPGAALVVVLHGARGTARDMRAKLGWDALADREGLVVAYPDGLDRTWNAGRCCGSARDRKVDDVGFLDELVATLRRDDGVGAVYAVGFSNGAMMSYAWACARPGALAGIGPVAGALTVDCPAPAPLTVVAVHGTRDERVPFEGGRGPSGVDFRSFDASLAPFRTAAACPAIGVQAVVAPARVDDRSCDGHAVVSDVVDGFTHVWPGAGPAAGTTTGPLDATGFLWAHLQG